ncbi:ORF23 [Streptococcus phage 01205]|uniref:ORF23 n=1 Tax=Streptococcus phage O1205 TaxID=85154 RepID=O34054_BPO12|nr:ORF23 [Streptococcus phage 01205]AAC79539.1 ORF23 [Streptococcus phage 01205]
MSGKYNYAGLTKELHQRLVFEFNALKEKHPRTFTHHIMKTKQCNRQYARKYCQRFDKVIKERSKLSFSTLDDMSEYLTEGLVNDLQEYLSEHYSAPRWSCKTDSDKTNAGLTEELFLQYRNEIQELRAAHPNCFANYIMEVKGCSNQQAKTICTAINTIYTEIGILTPRKVVQLEGLLSRELFGKIAKHVFNKYEWPESLDSEVDRIYLEYRTKGDLGLEKESVKRALYKAIYMGL